MCLCGMLAAEHGTLPEAMRVGLKHYFDANERWLARVLDTGRTSGDLHFEGKPQAVASLLVGALEGAMMLARSYGDARRFDAAAERLLADLRAPLPAPRKRRAAGAKTAPRAATRPARPAR
jgi:TetR/AcrR family transcriptional repressor of nem operon